MAQRFPTSGPSAAPPPGPMQPQQRYPGPAQPPGSPMPPRPYPGPNFPARSGFTPPPGGAGGAPPAGGRAAGGAAYGGGPAPAPLRPSPAPAPPAAAKRPGEARGPAPHKPGLYGAEGYAAGAGGAQAPKRKKRLPIRSCRRKCAIWCRSRRPTWTSSPSNVNWMPQLCGNDSTFKKPSNAP